MRALLIAAVVVALAPLARAEEGWTRLSLAGGVSIDVPDAAVKQALPATQHDATLMLFSLEESGKFLTCHLTWQAYTKEMTRAELVALIKAGKHGRLCLARHQGEAGLKLEVSTKRTLDGAPAGACVASYTAREAPRSRAETLLTVADEMAFYSLACGMASGDDAMVDWLLAWKKRIDHMEQSLRLR